MPVTKIICDEFHSYVGRHHVAGAIGGITRVQRLMFGWGGSVNPMSSTMYKHSPYEMDETVRSQRLGDEWPEWFPEAMHDYHEAIATAGLEFFVRYTDVQARARCSKSEFEYLRSRLESLASVSITYWQELGGDENEVRIRQSRDTFRTHVSPKLAARDQTLTLRFDRSTRWLDRPLIALEPVDRQNVVCEADTIPDRWQQSYTSLKAEFRQALMAKKSVQAKRRERIQQKRKVDPREVAGEAELLRKSETTSRDWKMVINCPLLLELIEAATGKPIQENLLRSAGLQELGCFTSTRLHPFQSRGAEIFNTSAKIRMLCRLVAEHLVSNRRKSGHIGYPAPVALVVWEPSLYYCIQPALRWHLEDDPDASPELMALRAELSYRGSGEVFTIDIAAPGRKNDDKDNLVDRFRDRPEVADGAEVGKKKIERPLDVLCLCAKTNISGLNLTECSFVIFLDIIPNRYTMEQAEARFDRPGQLDRVKVIQLLEHSGGMDTLEGRLVEARDKKAEILDGAATSAGDDETGKAETCGGAAHSPIVLHD